MRCRLVLASTTAKNGSNLRNGRHARAKARQMDKALRRELRVADWKRVNGL